MRIIALCLLLLPATLLADDEVQYIVRIDGVTCPFCVATSERALSKVEGVRSVRSDLDSGLVFVCADPSAPLSPKFLAELFRKRGFTYRSVRRTHGCDDDVRHLADDDPPPPTREHAEPAGGGY